MNWQKRLAMFVAGGIMFGASPSFGSPEAPVTSKSLSEVSISLGESKTIYLVKNSDGELELGNEPKSANDPSVSLRFLDWGKTHVLAVKNGYPTVLRYKALICISNPTRCAKTSVLPIGAGMSNYESWSNEVEFVVVSGFSLKDK